MVSFKVRYGETPNFEDYVDDFDISKTEEVIKYFVNYVDRIIIKSDFDKFNKEDRIFSGWGSVSIVDRQGDLIPIQEFEPVMEKLMKRGANIIDSHSNHKVGEIIDYQFAKTPEGNDGLYLTAKIYKDYESDDEVWENIKAGRYTGFSLGGKAGERIPVCDINGCHNVLKDIEAWEFSIVEKPANQDSVIDNVNKLAKGYTIQKPFAGYKDFDECVSQNRDKSNPQAYCGSIKHRVEKLSPKTEEIIKDVIDKKTPLTRIYIDNPKEAPKGVHVRRGPRGGYYYEVGEPKFYTPEEAKYKPWRINVPDWVREEEEGKKTDKEDVEKVNEIDEEFVKISEISVHNKQKELLDKKIEFMNKMLGN